MKYVWLILALILFAWAAWSGVRWLFMEPSSVGNYAGWKWIVSIAIELGLGGLFWGLAVPSRMIT